MTNDKKIIRFPNSAAKISSGISNFQPIAKLTVGPLSFHCTNCGEICHADFKNMIFRTIDFYCSSCGNFFKITNPAFVISPKTLK